MVEVPELRSAHLHCRQFQCAPLPGAQLHRGRGRFQRNPFPAFLIEHTESHLPLPGRGVCVADPRGDLQGSLVRADLRIRIHSHGFYERLGGDQQVNRPIYAAVVRPVAGASAGQHRFAERVVGADHNRVAASRANLPRSIDRECGVTLASVSAHFHAVHPNGSAVEHGFELDANRALGPIDGSVERTPIPAHTHVIGVLRLDLPGVRHCDLPPGRGRVRLIPFPGQALVPRVQAKVPGPVQGNPLGQRRTLDGCRFRCLDRCGSGQRECRTERKYTSTR